MRFLRHRIADERVLRLIGKWLAAGVIEDGTWAETGRGSPQGGLCAAAHNDPCGVPFSRAVMVPSGSCIGAVSQREIYSRTHRSLVW
jgi:hypothetical protein